MGLRPPIPYGRAHWAPLTEELHATMALAAELEVWVVVGGNHRLSGQHRPHNSLWVINDRGELADSGHRGCGGRGLGCWMS